MKRSMYVILFTLFVLALVACSAPTAVPTTAPATAAPIPTTAPAVQPTVPPTTAAPAASAGTAGESEAAARAAGLTFLADAYAGKYKGATVTMTGPFVDADAVKFNNSMKDFQTPGESEAEFDNSFLS